MQKKGPVWKSLYSLGETDILLENLLVEFNYILVQFNVFPDFMDVSMSVD